MVLAAASDHPAIVNMFATQALEKRGLATRMSIAAQNSPSEVFRF
jgi:hypothetical protein